MVKLKLFTLSFLFTAGILLALIYHGRAVRPPGDTPEMVQVGKDLFITSQLTTRGVSFLKRHGVGSLVDLRPDGEDPEEPPSSQIEAFSVAQGMDFHYIPVPHEEIPEEAVAALSEVLAHRTTKTVLYCRSGKRAVRTFALTEASRTGGPTTDAICEMVHTAGFSADDLKDNINERIAKRKTAEEEKP